MGEKAKVLVLMGSDSDLEVMKGAADALKELGVPCELRILSAHRAPGPVMEAARTAADRGYKVIICGAGMAAHLAGAVASQTTLPVIGVPLAGESLRGLDALYATAQMPPGVPVATVAIGGARNAGILAAQILATADEDLARRLGKLKAQLEEEVLEKDRKVRKELST